MNESSSSGIDRGSFRDPAGFVFRHAGEIYRAVGPEDWPLVETFAAGKLATELMASGALVESRVVPPSGAEHDALRQIVPGQHRFLWHKRIPFVSYPYEWSAGMLCDAAQLTLDLQIALLKEGLSLKDATAYNVQFRSGKPVFIDWTSVEKPRRFDVWVAYSQFCRMFVYPLALHALKGADFKQSFLPSMDGVSVEQAYAQLGRRRAWRPALLMDVALQRVFSGGNATSQRKVRSRLDQPRATTADAQLFNLRRLKRVIEWLQKRVTPRGHWSSYEATHSYSQDSRREKEAFVAQVLAERKPTSVLDLGCNTGMFSIMAAKAGARVIAADIDHDCVDRLYRAVRAGNFAIQPVLQDISCPSPGIGFMNRERSAFMDRAASDCVFALALVHHLLVTCRIPLAGLAELFERLALRDLVVEWVDPRDEMFKTLLALREDLYGHLTGDHFINALAPRFKLVRRALIPGTMRELMHFTKDRP